MDASFTGPNGSDPVAAIRDLKVATLPTESDARAALENQRERIANRTSGGTDASGARFTPYSAKYAQRKKTTAVDLGGRGGRLLSAIEPVTDQLARGEIALNIDGDEDAMIARVQNEGATIRSRLGTGKGKPKKNGKATFQIPARRFFDASPEELREMEDDIGSRIQSRLTHSEL